MVSADRYYFGIVGPFHGVCAESGCFAIYLYFILVFVCLIVFTRKGGEEWLIQNGEVENLLL